MAGATLVSRFKDMMTTTGRRLGLRGDGGVQRRDLGADPPRTVGREQMLDLTADAALEEILAIENGRLKPAPVLSPRKMLERIETGFTSLLELVGQMRDGLARQEARHAAAADAQDRLAQRMSMLPAAVTASARLARQNGEMLATLTRRIEAQTACQGALTEAMKVLPQSAAEQTAVIQRIHDQLLIRQELDRDVVSSMLSMDETLGQLSAAGGAQVSALGRLHEAHAQQAAAVQGAIDRQHRRFGWLFGLAVGLCTFVLAAAAALFVILMQ